VIVGQTVEATSVELRRKATPQSRVLPRCRGVRPRGFGDLAGKDFTPSLGVWRGQAMAAGFTHDGNRHSRLEAQVHRDADARRAMSVLVDGNRGSGFLPRVEAQVDGDAACSRPPWASWVGWLRRGGEACLDGRPRCGRPTTSFGTRRRVF
jgi:hypothetical protein